jgi:hypothetical protein
MATSLHDVDIKPVNPKSFMEGGILHLPRTWHPVQEPVKKVGWREEHKLILLQSPSPPFSPNVAAHLPA